MAQSDTSNSLPQSAAHRFLTAAVCRPPVARQELEAAANANTDWEAVARLAVQHNLRPLALWRLEEAGAGDLLPSKLAADWKDAFEVSRARNALILSEAEKLLRAFSGADVSAACLKGAVFAETIYPHPATRPMSDIDFLVRPSEIPTARRLLERRGYERTPASGREDAYIKGSGRGAHPFDVVVELQDDLLTGHVGNRKVARLRLDDLWADMREARVGGTTCLTLGPEHCMLFLAAHMAVHHGAFRILWLTDVAYGLADGAALDWPKLVERARRFGLCRAAGWALRLARELLRAPAPDAVIAELGAATQPEGGRRAILLTSLDAASPESLGRDASLVARAAFLDSAWDRVRYLAAMTRTGTPEGRPRLADATRRERPSALRLGLRFLRAARVVRRFGR